MGTVKNIMLATCLGLTLCCQNAFAQAKRTKATTKKVVKHETIKSDLLIEDMIQATAKLTIIDSLVVDERDFISHIPLAKDCGSFKGIDLVKGTRNGFVNGFGDTCFYSDSTKENGSKLYTAQKLGGKWQAARMLYEFGEEYEDFSYPFLLQDGVTLYFSARSKTKAVGGKDIFMARLNTDSMRFYKPENVGFPYNSDADDLCCIVDDTNHLGWLVTNRRQPKGKVCIYTFIPTTERWNGNGDGLSQKKLEALAAINRIADTWDDANSIERAKEALKSITSESNRSGENSSNIFFPINDKVVYRDINDFRTETGKKLFIQVSQLREKLKNDTKQLESLRLGYGKANGSNKKDMARAIRTLEKNTEVTAEEMKKIEKKIRNAENLM